MLEMQVEPFEIFFAYLCEITMMEIFINFFKYLSSLVWWAVMFFHGRESLLVTYI